jgi:hypothetical protein
VTTQQKITRDDLEAKFRGLQEGVTAKVQSKAQGMIGGLVIGGVLLLVVFFLLGRRSGRKKTTLVEIRRL